MAYRPYRRRLDEEACLSALYELGILDVGDDARLDAFTAEAAAATGADIAGLSFTDADREWAISRAGVGGPSSFARQNSFGAHASLSTELFVIQDAAQDARFRDHPFVIGEPQVRSYAGVPLIIGRDRRIGSLSVMYRSPFAISDETIRILTELAPRAVRLVTEIAQAHGKDPRLASLAAKIQVTRHGMAVFDRELELIASNSRWRGVLLGDESAEATALASNEIWSAACDRALSGSEQDFSFADVAADSNWRIVPWRDVNGEIAGVVMTEKIAG